MPKFISIVFVYATEGINICQEIPTVSTVRMNFQFLILFMVKVWGSGEGGVV